MGKAISACFSKYATFTGRASRSEYWFFYLFYILVYIGASILANASNSLIIFVPLLALYLPLLAAGVRRMHDVDKSGWFLLIPIYNLVLACTEGSTVANRFGPPTQQQGAFPSILQPAYSILNRGQAGCAQQNQKYVYCRISWAQNRKLHEKNLFYLVG